MAVEGPDSERSVLLLLFAFLQSSVFMHRVILLICAIVLMFAGMYKSRPGREPSAKAAFSVQTSSHGYVRISGDVRYAGIYPITANTMTSAVINMAMPHSTTMDGLLESEAADYPVNGMALQVTVRPDSTLQLTKCQMSVSERLIMGIPLDINSMSEADFDKVPGVGPKMAKRIVAYRQINGGLMRTTDLLSIEGIGEKKYKHLLKFF